VFYICFVLLKLDTNGKITTQLYDKRDDFNFSIVNFPYLCSNIPVSHAYGVYISQLIRYARACSTYDQFLVRGSLLTNKLMSQGFQLSRLQAAFRKFYDRYNDLICPYNLSLGHMQSDVSHQSLSHSRHTDLDYASYRLPNLEIGLTVGVTGRQGMLTPPRHLIPPLIYSEACVRPFSGLYFL
jgi:hypothetical protein